jgi:hypothetical protein
MPEGFASTPEPPYYAVIFTSLRTEGDNGYTAMAGAMLELAQKQPGCLGAETARDPAGLGITVAYFIDEDAIRAWREKFASLGRPEIGQGALLLALRAPHRQSGAGLRRAAGAVR